MEEKKEESEAEIHEHGPEFWFSKWERQCMAVAEQEEPNEEEVDQNQEKLWHLFQNSATAVAQLYKGPWPENETTVSGPPSSSNSAKNVQIVRKSTRTAHPSLISE